MISKRLLLLCCAVLLQTTAARADAFRVTPYLQNPAPDAVTVRWLSEADEPGVLTVQTPDGPREFRSEPKRATTLAYNPFKAEPNGPHPSLPWLHGVRVTDLKPGTAYDYSVRQGDQKFSGSFRTAPKADQPIRFIAISDPETEPESSTTPPVDWPASTGSNRPKGITRYVVDQTTGYRENLKVIESRHPDLLLISGDLVETGGMQRHWDEFWKHAAGKYGALAGGVPIVPAIGNHDNYSAVPNGVNGYSPEGAEFAVGKYLTYFDLPSNEAADPKHHGRYYRLDYGPVTLIVLDSSNGLPHKTKSDTNHYLEGSSAPDFNPGSPQYRWLEAQLADAQKTSRFTFVMFHHTMYGSGPHGIPFGHPKFSQQGGIPMRVLKPVFFRYGVDAVIAGHDELIERSMDSGKETLPDGSTRPHDIHFYDVGSAGDGLRGAVEGFDNPCRKFLAHENAPERWNGKQLVSGGKHYGHLEVNVAPNADGRWQAVLTPAYVFPKMNADGKVIGWERRTYTDVVTLSEDR